MSGGTGRSLANQLLNYVLGAAAFTPPPTVYIALYLTPPTALGEGTEVSASGYERFAVANNSSQWATSITQLKMNASAFVFDSAAVDWGTVVGAAVLDSPVATVPMFFGTLDEAKPVFAGDTPNFPEGTFRIQLL